MRTCTDHSLLVEFVRRDQPAAATARLPPAAATARPAAAHRDHARRYPPLPAAATSRRCHHPPRRCPPRPRPPQPAAARRCHRPPLPPPHVRPPRRCHARESARQTLSQRGGEGDRPLNRVASTTSNSAIGKDNETSQPIDHYTIEPRSRCRFSQRGVYPKSRQVRLHRQLYHRT